MFLMLSVSWMLIKQQNVALQIYSFNVYSEDCAVIFYIWLFNFFNWILLDLPEEYKALFI